MLRPTALSLFIALAACGGSKSEDSRPATALATTTAAKQMSFEDLNLKPLTCGAPKGCPEAVGQLVVQTMNGPEFCTATLVAPRVVLTASHCLPLQNAQADGKINGNCWIRWVDGQPIPCDAIVENSGYTPMEEGVVQSDWAFIQLKQNAPARKPIKLGDDDANSERDRRSVILFGVSVATEQHTIRRERCLRDDAQELPNKKALPGETIILPNCHIEVGYSGGPIFATRSKSIIGVVSFMRTKKNDPRTGRGLAVGTDAPSRLP